MLIFAMVKEPHNPQVIRMVSTTVDISECELHDLGGGFRGVVINIPHMEQTAVICTRTGAVFGGTLAKVRQQLKESKIYDSPVRIKNCLLHARSAQYLDVDQFWTWIREMLSVQTGKL